MKTEKARLRPPFSLLVVVFSGGLVIHLVPHTHVHLWVFFPSVSLPTTHKRTQENAIRLFVKKKRRKKRINVDMPLVSEKRQRMNKKFCAAFYPVPSASLLSFIALCRLYRQ
jgi:hypothetical protein